MDSKLVLIALVVIAMSCLTPRMDAQSATTAVGDSTTPSAATTMASTASTAATTMASTASTPATTMASTASTPATTMASTASTAANTMASTASTTANTMASTASTTANTMASTASTTANTMASTASTTANTMASTASTAATTMASTASTAAATNVSTTATPPLSSNTTVTNLTTNITRTNCGTTQFCAAQPSICDPASNSCFFVSSMLQSGQNVNFQISGPSAGYIALGLYVAQTKGSTNNSYICANNNGTINFFSAILNGGTFTPIMSPNVNNVKGVVKGSLIQCSFAATVPNATARASSTSFFVFLSNGTFVNETLGSPNDVFRSATAVDVSNPNSTTTNALAANTTATNTTAAPTTAAPTTSGEGPFHHFLSQALLIVLGVLGLAML